MTHIQPSIPSRHTLSAARAAPDAVKRSLALASAIIMGFVMSASTANAQATAPGATQTAAPHTAALFSYTGSDQPIESFAGVIIQNRYIITSTAAVKQTNHRFLRKGVSEPASHFYALVGKANERTRVGLRLLNEHTTLELSVLEIDPADRDPVASLNLPPVKQVPSKQLREAQAVGPVSPFGLLADQISDQTVSPHVAMPVSSARPGLFDTQLMTITQSLPASMAGAGVWSKDGELLGVLMRQAGMWHVADPQLLLEKLVKGSTGTATKPTTPTNPNTTPANPTTPAATLPSTTPNANESSSLDALAPYFQKLKLTAVLPPGLIDAVSGTQYEDQANDIMAYIAAGQFQKALEYISVIYDFSKDDFREHLTYRRALALTLTGKFAEANEALKSLRLAKQAAVRGRAIMLNKVLDEHKEGQFNGKPLTEPATLAEAWKAQLEPYAKRFTLNLKQIQQVQLVSTASFERIIQSADQLRKQLDEAVYYWPGHFAAIRAELDAHYLTTVRNEYARCRLEMETAAKEYDDALKKCEPKRAGGDFVKEGFWPKSHVDRANLQADKFNEMLKHYKQVEQSLPKGEAQALPKGLDEPLKRLLLAVKREAAG